MADEPETQTPPDLSPAPEQPPTPEHLPVGPPGQLVDREALQIALLLGRYRFFQRISQQTILAAMDLGERVAGYPIAEVVDAGAEVYALSTIAEDPRTDRVHEAIDEANIKINECYLKREKGD